MERLTDADLARCDANWTKILGEVRQGILCKIGTTLASDIIDLIREIQYARKAIKEAIVDLDEKGDFSTSNVLKSALPAGPTTSTGKA